MKNIVAFDIETTGLDKKKDHIIQISMIKFNPETYEILETYNSYIKPVGSYSISIPAYMKHKIKPEFLIDKPTIKDIADDIVNFFEDCDVLTYNGNSFDIPFLNIELGHAGKHIDFTCRNCYDSFLTEKSRYPTTLEGIFEKYMGKTMEDANLNAHDALSDIHATMAIFKMQNDEEKVDPVKIYGDSGMVKDMVIEGKTMQCFAYGKYRAIPVALVAKFDKTYLQWVISNKCDVDNDTKKVVEKFITD